MSDELILFKVTGETTAEELHDIADTLEDLDELEEYGTIVASDMQPVDKAAFREMLESMLENLEE